MIGLAVYHGGAGELSWALAHEPGPSDTSYYAFAGGSGTQLVTDYQQFGRSGRVAIEIKGETVPEASATLLLLAGGAAFLSGRRILRGRSRY